MINWPIVTWNLVCCFFVQNNCLGWSDSLLLVAAKGRRCLVLPWTRTAVLVTHLPFLSHDVLWAMVAIVVEPFYFVISALAWPLYLSCLCLDGVWRWTTCHVHIIRSGTDVLVWRGYVSRSHYCVEHWRCRSIFSLTVWCLNGVSSWTHTWRNSLRSSFSSHSVALSFLFG